MIYRGDNILRGFDEDVRKHVRAEMEKQGITILTGCTIDKVDKHGNEFTTHLSNGSSIASEKVMFAIGRHPNVANLGLEKAGVAINPNNGGIAVDGWSKTSVDNIYAIGDVTHRINLTPVAIREGHAFADTVFGKRPVQVDHATIPTAVFSQPEVGTVGLTEAEARAQFSHVDIYKADFRPIKATMSGRDTRVLMKLVVDGIKRSRARLSHRRRRRRRNRPGGRDRREDEGDQGRFRRDDRAASDGGRRTGDDAHADGAACEAGGGVGPQDGWSEAIPSLHEAHQMGSASLLLRATRLNKSRPGALIQMAKTGSSSAGPMRTQPIQLGSMQPTQPLMPSAGTEVKPQSRAPRKSPSRAEQIDAAKAKISRRNSLRKQRAALKS